MTCRHGTDPMPAARPWESDEALMAFMGLPDTEKGRAILARTTATERQQYAEMRAVAEELQAGRIPKGVIACNRIGRTVR